MSLGRWHHLYHTLLLQFSLVLLVYHARHLSVCALSVQELMMFGRRAVYTFLATFLVVDPSSRAMTFGLLTMVILLVHVHVQPFRDVSDNRGETVFLAVLAMLSLLLGYGANN